MIYERGKEELENYRSLSFELTHRSDLADLQIEKD